MEGMVTRDMWGAEKPRWIKRMVPPIEVIRPTFTDTEYCFDRECADEVLHQLQSTALHKMNMPDIHWNFIIGTDGTLYEGRGWYAEGYKTKQTKKEFGNKVILEVGFIGNAEGMDPLEEAGDTLHKLIRYGVKNGLIMIKHDVVKLHRIT